MRMMLTTMTMAALATAGAGAQGSTPGFCERLAPQLGMKLKPGTAKAAPLWEANTLGGIKTALLGGSTMISFGIKPVGEPSVADYQRLQGTCAQNGKEIVCRVVEPLHLTVQAKGGAAQVEAAPGEKATVATRGTRITCRNG